MTAIARRSSLALLALVGLGCDQPAEVPTSPTAVAEPSAGAMLAEKKAEPAEPELAANLPADVSQIDREARREDEGAGQAGSLGRVEGDVKLEKVNFDEFLSRIAAEQDGQVHDGRRLGDLVRPVQGELPARRRDAPEVRRQGPGRRLALVRRPGRRPSRSATPRQFLAEKKAVFTNFLLDEEQGVGFEKLDINAIPAVFLYGPDGKEVKRFTMDDPNHQFTYDEVEKTVVALLDGKPAAQMIARQSAGTADASRTVA